MVQVAEYNVPPQTTKRSLSVTSETYLLAATENENPCLDANNNKYSTDSTRPAEGDASRREIGKEKFRAAEMPKACACPSLITFDKCPEYLQDNPFILNGYRSAYTYHEAFHSILHVHNESLNIWSHSLALLLAITGLIATLSSFRRDESNLKLEDLLLVSLFFLMSAYTFLASTLFHTLLCVSKQAHDRFICLDFSGVSAILACCSISYTYPLYACHPTARLVWILALLLVNTAGIIGPSHKIWMTVDFKNGRVAVYACSALLSLLPFICYFILPSTRPVPQDILLRFGMTLLQLGFGALLFALKMPERFMPGFFDIWANSHAIFHFLAMGAMITMWQTVLLLINWKNADKFCAL